MSNAKRRDVFVERHLIIVMVIRSSTDQAQGTSFSMADGVQWGLAALCCSYVLNFGWYCPSATRKVKILPQNVI
jgi:hypothetical protein